MRTNEKRKGSMKRIVVRKPGSVRLTSMCANYGYGYCCCGGDVVQ
jgi:hypothetical protein